MAVIYTDKTTGLRFKFDDGTTPEQAREYMRSHYEKSLAAQEEQDKREREEYLQYRRDNTNAISHGISRGIDQIPILGNQLGALASSLVGAEESRDSFLKAAAEREVKLDQEYPKLYETLAQDPLGYAGELFGEQGPNIATTVASGGLGAIVGRGGAALAARTLAKETAEEAAAATARQAALRAIARNGAAIGAPAGAGLGSYGLQAGENYGDYVGRYGVDTPGIDYAAAATALPQAALDVYGLRGLGKAFGPRGISDFTEKGLSEIADRGLRKTLASGAAREIPRAMVVEGLTEGSQEALKRLGGSITTGNNEFADPATWGQIGESALAGALVGGPFGGIGGAQAGVRERADAARRLQNLRASGNGGWHTPYTPGQTQAPLLGLPYDPNVEPTPLPLEFDPTSELRQAREAERQGRRMERQIEDARGMGPHIGEGGMQTPDMDTDVRGGLSGMFQPPSVAPGPYTTQDAQFDPSLDIGPLRGFLPEINRANAAKPSEFDQLMREAALTRQQLKAAQDEAAAQAATIKQGERPPTNRLDPIIGNDLFNYQAAERGVEPGAPAQPAKSYVDPYTPVNERSRQDMLSSDQENQVLPGVQPALFDDATASPRADIVAPFVEAGMVQNSRNTPYARAAKDLFEKFMGDRRQFDPMDPEHRKVLFSMLEDLSRFSRNPISLSTPQEREGLGRLREALAADPAVTATRTVPAAQTTAPVTEQESALPTERGVPRLPDKKRQVSAEQAAEVAPEQLATAQQTWDAARPDGTPSWAELRDPQFQQVRRGNETVLEPIAQDKDAEFQSALTNDAKNTFARWTAENPNATPEQVQAEIRRTADDLARPLDLDASPSNERERRAETTAVLAPKAEANPQGRAVKGAGRGARTLTDTEKSVKAAAQAAKTRIKTTNRRARGEVPILDHDEFESAVRVKIPKEAIGKEEPNERLAQYIVDGEGGSRPLDEVLQKLITTTKDPRNKALAQRLLALMGDRADRVNVRFKRTTPGSDSLILGAYQGSDSRGTLALYDIVFNMKRLEETLLHEAVHAATVGAYQDNRAFRREIDALFAEAKKLLPDWASSNAYDNPYEFITASLTNPDFRAALQAADTGAKMSLWDRFVAAVRQLFNRSSPLPKSVLERMDEILERGWEVESLRTPMTTVMNSELRSQSGTVFENDTQWRKKVAAEANTVSTRVKSAFEAAVGSRAKSVVAGSTDLRSLAKMLDELSVKVFGKGNNPGQRLVDTLAKQDATDRSVRATFDTKALEPLRALRKQTPEVFSKVEDMLFKASYMRFDPTSKDNRQAPTDAKARAEQKQLVAEYNALPDAGKKAFNAVLKTTRESFNEMTTGLLKYNQRMVDEMRATVAAATGDEKQKLQAKYAAAEASFDRLKSVLAGLGSVGPYVPFMRHGDYLISYVGPDGVQGVTAYDTATARDAAYNVMIKEGATAEKFNRYTEPAKFLDTLDVAGRTAARAIRDVRDNVLENGAPDDIKSLFDDIETRLVDLLGATTPAGRLLENVRDRQNVPGMHTDILRGLSDYATTAGKALSSLQHGTEIGRAFRDANRLASASSAAEGRAVPSEDQERLYLSGEELAKAEVLVRELNKRREFMMNPIHSPVANFVAKAGFLYFMGVNPSSAALQLFQLVLGQFPILAGKYGADKAFSALYDSGTRIFTGEKPLRDFLVKGAQDLARYDATMLDERGRAKPGADSRTQEYARLRNGDQHDQYRAMVVDMLRLGTVNDSGTQDLLQFKGGSDPDSKLAQVEKVAGSMMRWIENTNRLASAMAAFDLARQKNKDWDSALREASQSVYEGHGDYSAMNSPRWFQSNVGKVMLLFKKFGFHMYTQMAMQARDAINSAKTKEERAEAAKKLGIMMLATGATTGVAGLPMYGLMTTIFYLYQSAFGDDDETRNLTMALRSAAESAGVNPDVREVFLKGASTLAGLNLSSRLGYSDIFFRDPEENLDQTKVLEWAATTLGGPAAGAVSQLARGATQVAEGDPMAGVVTMLPTAIRNLGKAWQMGTEGEVKTRRGDPIAETDAVDALLQAVGFRPAQLDLQMDVNLAAKAIDQRLIAKRANLLRRYRVAYAAGDTDTLSSIREEVTEWNAQARRLSAPKLVVSPDTLKKSVDSMQANNALLRHGMVYSRQAMHVTDNLRALSEE